MPVAHRETVESQGVEAVLLDIGEGHVELLRPLGPDTPIGKYLDNKGPGLHHVAYAVDDIEGVLGEFKEAGIEMIDSEPRVGIRQSRTWPRSPALHRRGADRNRRACGGTLMAAERIEIGFVGGQVIGVRVAEAKLKELRKEISSTAKKLDQSARWFELESEDGAVTLDLTRIVFIRGAPASIASASPDEAAPPGARRCRRRRRGGALVAEEPVRLPLRAALLGRGAASADHPGAASRDTRPPAG